MSESEPWWLPAMKIFAQASGLIIVPLLIGLFLGQWLDDRYHTTPWLQISAVAVAFVVTMAGLYKLTRDYQRAKD